MKNRETNLFIVNPNEQMAARLKNYLANKFGNRLHTSIFNDGRECVDHIDKETDIVILSDLPKDQQSLGILKLIKSLNHRTEVIILSKNEDIAQALESFIAGAKDYVLIGRGAWSRVAGQVFKVISSPARIIAEEFQISLFLAIFLLTFVIMGAIVSFFWIFPE
ncbi:MAG: response regulator [Bacteroidota bacterium]